MHQRMSDLIFCDPEKKRQAEGILHPLIKKSIFEELALHAKAVYCRCGGAAAL